MAGSSGTPSLIQSVQPCLQVARTEILRVFGDDGWTLGGHVLGTHQIGETITITRCPNWFPDSCCRFVWQSLSSNAVTEFLKFVVMNQTWQSDANNGL
jgi:hypothetical protein